MHGFDSLAPSGPLPAVYLAPGSAQPAHPELVPHLATAGYVATRPFQARDASIGDHAPVPNAVPNTGALGEPGGNGSLEFQ